MKQLLFFISTLLISFSSLNAQNDSLQKITENQHMENALYSIPVQTIDGKETILGEYQGKKLIILNVASECGYTAQYADWQLFYTENKEKGIEVLGFPCNQFGGQEPGTEQEIVSFCQKNFGVTFPMLAKGDVKGQYQIPLYKWLTDPKLNGWNDQVPNWNFCKYLINEEGKLVQFFASGVTPEHPDFLKALGQ